MRNIKCAYVMCKFNSANVTKNENGSFDVKEDLGVCSCEDEIVLGEYECDECGNVDGGLDCKNFEYKIF